MFTELIGLLTISFVTLALTTSNHNNSNLNGWHDNRDIVSSVLSYLDKQLLKEQI